MTLSPLNKRRLNNFKSNKRGWYSFLIFTFLFLVSIFADFIANEKPLLIKYQNQIYLPIINEYAETTFGGDFETEADYRDPFVKDLINNNGWMIWPIIPYSYDTIIRDLAVPAPAPPSKKNWLGTDDQARDVLARLIYGFRISILFGFTLTFFSMLIGVSGIGPKTAIVLLSAVSPDEFKRRLIASEVTMLTALPGIGPKTARRIIVELKDKFVKLSKDELPKEESDIAPEVSDAYDALLALGFQMKDIRNSITTVQNQGEKLSTEELIKLALAELR